MEIHHQLDKVSIPEDIQYQILTFLNTIGQNILAGSEYSLSINSVMMEPLRIRTTVIANNSTLRKIGISYLVVKATIREHELEPILKMSVNQIEKRINYTEKNSMNVAV